MAVKPQAIQKRHDKSCAICFAINSDKENNKPIKFYCYEDETWMNREKNYICDNCLKDIKDIRKKCHQIVDNPKKLESSFKDYFPWFAREIPDMMQTMSEDKKKLAQKNKN